jgi:uncharacterized protein YbjT (DUF2867 family)
VDIVTLDYKQPQTLRAALRGVDRVFFVGPPTRDLTILERQAIDEIRGSGVRLVVKLSAMGGRAAIFPRQHADSEDYLRASGVAYTLLRPNGFMQNFVNYHAPTITTQNVFYGSQGDGKVSHIDLRDIAAVAVKVLTGHGHEGKAYTLTGAEALSNARIAEILSDGTGRDRPSSGIGSFRRGWRSEFRSRRSSSSRAKRYEATYAAWPIANDCSRAGGARSAKRWWARPIVSRAST